MNKFGIDHLLQRPVSFYPAMARALGGINEALLLQQLNYWSDKGTRRDGWIWKTKADIESETCLSRFQQDSARGKLEKMGIIETKVMRAEGKPTIHYRVSFQNVRNLLLETSVSYVSKTQVSSVSITESTTESTTESIRKVETVRLLKEMFDSFYKKYPRKIGKDSAIKTWNKLKPNEELVNQIIEAVEAYKNTELWSKDKGRYIPHPATFLNQKRWEDDIAGLTQKESVCVDSFAS